MDVVCVNLEKDATSSSVLNIRRGETHGIVDVAARRRTALLVPHFQRAVSIGRLFDQSKMTQIVLTEAFDHLESAVFLVERNGRIVFANETGRVMLDDGILLRERSGGLTAVSPEAQRMLMDLLAAAESGDLAPGNHVPAVPLSAALHPGWFADVLPLTSGDRQRAGALAAVFIRKTSSGHPPPLEALANTYKLTASELRVLEAMMKVDGARALADLLGLSQATVKTHLHHLFRKTGATRQSELVKLVAGFDVPAQD
jgi:DNA-binding CsgD family transcriptional regulator